MGTSGGPADGSGSPTTRQPSTDSRVIDLGHGKTGEVVNGVVPIENKTDEPQLVAVEASCGCTDTRFPQTLDPHERRDVELSIVVKNVDRPTQRSNLTVTVGGAVEHYVLQVDVDGFVPATMPATAGDGREVLVDPPVVSFGLLHGSEAQVEVSRRVRAARGGGRVAPVERAVTLQGMEVQIEPETLAGEPTILLVGDLRRLDFSDAGFRRTIIHVDVTDADGVVRRVPLPLVVNLADDD